MQHALVTGAAGFIGSHLVDRLLSTGWQVTALDNFDNYYARAIKMANIRCHLSHPAYTLLEQDIRDVGTLESVGGAGPLDAIVHLAGRGGVQPSIREPSVYHDINVSGTLNLLELARQTGTRRFVFASSSSVYGLNQRLPWKETEINLLPVSPYASTKLSAEFLGHVYSYLHGVKFMGLRFFTVYGPRLRPDLAIHRFATNILSGTRIQIYGDGGTRRDYTHVSDIVKGICAAMRYTASPFEIFNLGNNNAVELRELIAGLEAACGRCANVERLLPQPGDAPHTWADISKASALLGYRPETSLADGLRGVVEWLRASGTGGSGIGRESREDLTRTTAHSKSA
jgi:UDP-glucuronate 4-epimerase